MTNTFTLPNPFSNLYVNSDEPHPSGERTSNDFSYILRSISNCYPNRDAVWGNYLWVD
ncbi:MAG: hypothetical protein HC907_38515 [Richelia sp. SM1_7_0]|nr:hypothetical protein [Richelia sp. SM1_7_0]